MSTPVEQWKVKKVANAAPRTPTYEVDPIDGDDVFSVSVFAGDTEPTCWVHGTTCDHAKAVALHLAKKR